MTGLFDRFDLKGLPLSDRAVMSAMTRTHATGIGAKGYTDYPVLADSIAA